MKKYKVLNEAGEFLYPEETAKIDKLLEEIAGINSELGKNSTDSEKKSVWRRISNREIKIRDIDPVFYNQIHPVEDDLC
jgi:hypothetical protein